MQTPDGMFQDVTLRQFAAGTYTAGRWVPGASTDSTIVASVQPAKPAELQHLPEGDRTRGAVKFYTESTLQAGDESQGLQPDEITWDGEQWEVLHVWPWVPGITHHKGLALRVDRGR